MYTEHFKKYCRDNKLSIPNMMWTKKKKKQKYSMSVRIKDIREVRASDQCIHVHICRKIIISTFLGV